MLESHPAVESHIQPDVMRRTGGGWLAIAPKDAKIAIGVTASTESEAREKFASVFQRWVEILASAPKVKEAAN